MIFFFVKTLWGLNSSDGALTLLKRKENNEKKVVQEKKKHLACATLTTHSPNTI